MSRVLYCDLELFKSEYEFAERISKMDKRQFGIVGKKFDTFLFVVDMEGNDRFCHFTFLSRSSVKPFHHFRTGDKVSFIPAINDENKPIADELEFVPRPKEKE